MRKTLIIIIPFIHEGGVERLTANMFNYSFRNDDLDTFLYVMNSYDITGGLSYYENNTSEFFNISKNKLFEILQDKQRNNYVFSALTPANIFSIRLKFKFNFKLITSVQCTLFNKIPFYKRILLYPVYNFINIFSDRVHVITDGVRNDVEKLIGKSSKILKLSNPTLSSDLLDSVNLKLYPQKTKIRFVSLGRLADQKGFDITIKAFGKLRKKYSNFSYYIAGEGEKRKLLEELIKENDLEKFVFLDGFKNDFINYYADKEIYLFPSRFEGMGLALAEALNCALIPVSSNCNYGPSEILKDGELGLLVDDFENPDAWAKVLETFLSNEEINWNVKIGNHLEKFSTAYFMNRLLNSYEGK